MQIAECHCCKVDYHELLFLLGTCLTRFQPRANRAERAVDGGPVLFIGSGLAPGSDMESCQTRPCPVRGADPIWPLHHKKKSSGRKVPGSNSIPFTRLEKMRQGRTQTAAKPE